MKLQLETSSTEDYLVEEEVIDFNHPIIQGAVKQLYREAVDERDKIKRAYNYVRDEIKHSWDIQSTRVTQKASEVLNYKEGICYAKANLLAALLRAIGVPTGFCYQRLTLGDTPETGYCIHALNAVYLSDFKHWIRLDARGNKEGIQARFSIGQEQLAFKVRDAYDEVDYPTIYKCPNLRTMETLSQYKDCIQMYKHHLPESIE